MTEQELYDLLSALNLYTSVFLLFIVLCCEQFSKRSGIPCKFFIEQNVVLDAFTNEQKHHLLRIIQEALNNVQVHCNAEETSVIIRKSDHSDKEPSMPPQRDTIRIMIFDDGTGFDTAAMQTAHRLHFGLSGMEMRAKLLGGTLTITSNPETGTEVRIDVLLE